MVGFDVDNVPPDRLPAGLGLLSVGLDKLSPKLNCFREKRAGDRNNFIQFYIICEILRDFAIFFEILRNSGSKCGLAELISRIQKVKRKYRF